MQMDGYNHLIDLNFDDCIGCTRCMRICPTEAIRIVNGKVKLLEEKCINCGSCFSTCHVHAFKVQGDRKEALTQYRFNAVILPIAIYGMIKELDDLKIIYRTLYDLGFDAIFDSSIIYEWLGDKIEDYLCLNHENKPYILTHCPSIVKLIQLKYPSLRDHLVPFDFPLEIGAKLIRKFYAKKLSLNFDEIGISYMTECVANYMAIKQPTGKEKSNVDLVFLLSNSLKTILEHIHSDDDEVFQPTGSVKGILWAKVGGVRRMMNVIDCLSVDGMNQVVEILEKLELGQLDNINVLEAYACVGGCVGGTFTLENPFIAKSKINRLVGMVACTYTDENQEFKKMLSDVDWVFEKELEVFDISRLDDDFVASLIKLQSINDIYDHLPKIDCCACGSPSCRALAEDIVLGLKQLSDCMVLAQSKRGGAFDGE